MIFQDMEDLKAKSRIRYKTEAKNAKPKQVFGYDRVLSYYATARRYGHLCSKYQEDLQINLREGSYGNPEGIKF